MVVLQREGVGRSRGIYATSTVISFKGNDALYIVWSAAAKKRMLTINNYTQELKEITLWL